MGKPNEAVAALITQMHGQVNRDIAALKERLPKDKAGKIVAEYESKIERLVSDAVNSVPPETVKAALRADLLASLDKS